MLLRPLHLFLFRISKAATLGYFSYIYQKRIGSFLLLRIISPISLMGFSWLRKARLFHVVK